LYFLPNAERRKLSIRKLISSNSPHQDFSDEMAQLRWRIDALRSFSHEKSHGINNPNSTSLVGHNDPSINRELTFDELYERQQKKFGVLRERRKSKTSDARYIEMIGNLQMRKEKRRLNAKSKVDGQMQLLRDYIEAPLGDYE
jgi:hypothetical protein